MEQTYRIKTIGLKEGFAPDQAMDLLAKLLKRTREQVEPLQQPVSVIIKKGLDLPAAAKYKAALEDCGCISRIEPELAGALSRLFPHAMLQLDPPESGQALEVIIPHSRCCNCGAKRDISGVETPLSIMQGGAPLLVAADFPYCDTCVPTAYKARPSMGRTAIIAAGALAIYTMGVVLPLREAAFAGPASSPWLLALFAGAAGLAFHFMNKGVGKQTTRFQPVSLTTLRYNSEGIEAIGFKFSNASYQKDFDRVNKGEIKKGRII